MTSGQKRALDLDSITLKAGAHASIEEGGCFMEWVAWLAGEPHSDHPECVSRVIGAFMRSWNDGLNVTDRQMLKPLIPEVLKTAASHEIELQRSLMALDWYCRVSAPAWFRLAGLSSEAEAIEATTPIVDNESARAAQSALNRARDSAYTAGAAAWDAARAAAGDAAWDAARAAAWDAAWDAARAAAWDAAWDAAGDAARAAARDALRPTVEQLQASAIALVREMIAPSAPVEATA